MNAASWPGSFMMNHEILEKHESEESCDSSIKRHRVSCQCCQWGPGSCPFFPFVSFEYFVVNNLD